MNRDALLVGINQYPFLKDNPTSKAKHLNTPASDAEAIALRLEEYGGFRVRRLPESIQEEQRRVDPKKLVQGDALYEAIIQLFNPVGDSVSQTALLYFAGHGLRRNLGGVTEGFLATSDSDPRKNQWGVSLRWLRELLQRSPVQQQIVWLDCCYSGELLNFAEADLGTAGQGRTRFFIAAAREFEPAEENIQGQHGVFSQVLWQGLDPRRQPEGVVNNDRLIEYIDQRLKGTPQQPIWYNPNCEILLTGAREEVFVSTPDAVCPYKGLRFFDVEDAPYFYGREALTQKLIERVQVGKGNFLAVLGVSGSGKSSLLRAGLIMYQLEQERRLPGTEQWKIRIFTPGEQPLMNLATAFLDEEVTDIERAEQLKEAEEAIAQGATGLARLIRASKSLRTVLIVDQFEEVFTVCQSQTERQQFISGLLDALKQTGDKLCLIFAMRDDFLGKCTAYRELADLIQANLVMVTPMNAQELRQAIVEPAKKLGRKVEENLIDAILKDLGVEVEQQTREPEPGMLPLLSYTLEQLWQRQTLNWLKLDSYNQLGGVQKTLENLAEQSYRQLSVEEQRVADQIFIKLTQLGEGTPDTRKQVPQGDLVAQPESAGLVERVIQQLALAKLIVTSEQRKGQENVAVVDVAHEALIRYWSRLRELLDNNREAIRTERKIQAAAEEWREKGKSKDYLLTGLRLGEAEKFLEEEADIVHPSSLAQEFIEESRKERDRLQAEQRHRRHRTILGLTSFSTITLILAVVAGLGWQQSDIQRKRVEDTQLTQSRALSEYSQQLINQDKGLDALIAGIRAGKPLISIRGIDAATYIQVVTVLKQAVDSIQADRFNEFQRLSGHASRVASITYSPDSQIFASTSSFEEKKAFLWSQDGTLLKTLEHGDTVTSVSFNPDRQTLASSSWDKTVKIWKRDGSLLKSLEHSDRVYDVKFNSNGTLLVSASLTELKLWNSDGSLIKTLKHRSESEVTNTELELAFTIVEFSPDNRILVSASEDGTINLWNLDGTLLKTLKHDRLSGISFSPDSQTIASFNDEGIINIWSRNGTLLKTLKHDHLSGISFSPDSQTIASFSDEGIISIWSRNGTLLKTLKHNATVTAVSFSPDSQTLASSSWDKTVKIWSREGSLLQTLEHDDRVTEITFSPNGQVLASGSWDGRVRLWNRSSISSLKILKDNDLVTDIIFSPDSQILASGSRDGKAGGATKKSKT